jgi:nitrous oxidase accessory protein NosD/nitrous oxide reductase accessory protein NosL
VLALLLVTSAAFAVPVAGGSGLEPVPFDDTLTMSSLTQAQRFEAKEAGHAIPKAEAFYSSYRYVVGYEGIGSLVEELHREGHRRQFGMPLAIYVSDFVGTEVSLTEEGYLTMPESRRTGWVPAERAYFAVDSRARIPGGPAVVPFSRQGAARRFVDRYGGEVVGWAEVRNRQFGSGGATRDALTDAIRSRSEWANRTVDATSSLLDRPVSIVVGEDAPTVATAIDRAPPNTTVRIPAGTYSGVNVTIDKPLTLSGAGETGTHLNGTGNGSVVTVEAPRVAVTNLSIAGVGTTKQPEDVPAEEGTWDYRIKMAYAYGDAGIVFHRSNGSLVRDVTLHTPTNGVVLRYSEGAVVDDVTVFGRQPWEKGYMSVMVLTSRIVVQDSRLVDGRDGVYTHRSHGIVIRNNHMEGLRFGVHEMYTSDALVRNNVVRDAGTGLIVMTRPTGNALVGNDVRECDLGISVAGTESFVADNVLADNRYGLDLTAYRTLYTGNVVANNQIGVTASTLIPTNRVYGNDFVGNDRYVQSIMGPVRVWTVDGRGNYWEGAPGHGRGDGTLDRPFYPTGPVDSHAHRASGIHTLALSPAVGVLRWQGNYVPGLRSTGAADLAPLAEPANPAVVANVTRAEGAS